jgi:hypothetical protein
MAISTAVCVLERSRSSSNRRARGAINPHALKQSANATVERTRLRAALAIA